MFKDIVSPIWLTKKSVWGVVLFFQVAAIASEYVIYGAPKLIGFNQLAIGDLEDYLQIPMTLLVLFGPSLLAGWLGWLALIHPNAYGSSGPTVLGCAGLALSVATGAYLGIYVAVNSWGT